MKIKQILKSKRGIALENAIIFMIVIFTLCALLTSLTLISHYQVKLEQKDLARRVELDQIGEDFLASEQKNTFNLESNEKYDCTATETALTVWRRDDDGKRTVLYVEIENSTQGVVAWRYSSPTQND